MASQNEDDSWYTPADSPDELITDTKNLKKTLAKYGVAVIPNVLNEEEVKKMQHGMWSFLEHITQHFKVPISRDDQSTWGDGFSQLYSINNMLIQQWGIGHAQFLWDLRQNPKIVEIFAELWNTKAEELLVSFDGASMAFPHEVTKLATYYSGVERFHLDQRLSDPSFQCVQSWVTAWDVFPGDATLTALEGSHSLFESFSREFKLTSYNHDWYSLKKKHTDWFRERGCVVRDIVCSAGSMVFWDSRTVHSGKQALERRDHPSIRGVGYLCYTPRSLASDIAFKTKRRALKDLKTTSHWPHRPAIFRDVSRYALDVTNVEPIPAPKLTELGRRLAGYD